MGRLNIYAFADEASAMIDGQITAMKRNNLDGLEIRNVDGVNVAEISDYKAREVRKKMDDAGLKVWSIGSPIGKHDIDAENDTHLEKFRRTLEIADILGAENIRLFSYFPPKDKNFDDYTEMVINRFCLFRDYSQGSGITLCHENEKGVYGDTPERCLNIHKAVPEIKAIFDPANYIQCGVDTLKAWEMLKPYVKYLHIKDALDDGNIVPAGKGIGNIKHILNDFMNKGGECVTLEPHLTVFPGLDNLEKQDDKSVVGEVYKFASNDEAFDAAVTALRELI